VTAFDVEVDAAARESRFSGAVLVDRVGSVITAAAYGLADRRSGTSVELSTQFGLASGTKLFTALTVMSLIESGHLQLNHPVRGPLGTKQTCLSLMTTSRSSSSCRTAPASGTTSTSRSSTTSATSSCQ
jgi:CubicO group peptidase (beta-lactamase class C family)